MANSSRNLGWLDEELNRWVAKGIIDNTQADKIRRLYPAPRAARPWALIVFSGMGAVIAGLGVILVFAYNWQEIPKFGKLAIILGALAAAHSGGIWLYLRYDRFRGLGEGLTVLGTMLFGAGIWLVAQIYHIEEHFPNGVLIWAFGALLLAWALPSVAQAIIAAVLLTIWSGLEFGEFGSAMHAAPLIILVVLGPLAYLKRSRVLLGVLILAFGFSTGFAVSAYADGEFTFNVLLSIAAAFVAVGVLQSRYGKFPESSPIFHFFGFATYIVMLYVLTFSEAAEEVLEINLKDNPGVLFYWLPAVAFALTTWAMVTWPLLPWCKKRLRDYPYDLLLIPLTLVLFQFHALLLKGPNQWPVTAPFNLVFLAHAVGMMERGCKNAKLSSTILGSFLLVALVLARYIDLFHSLVARGLIFVVVGAVLIGGGVAYTRSKKKRGEPEKSK